MSENGLDRCINKDDWVRKEIVHGMKYRRNIIPIFMRNFEWPLELPEELTALPQYNSHIFTELQKRCDANGKINPAELDDLLFTN